MNNKFKDLFVLLLCLSSIYYFNIINEPLNNENYNINLEDQLCNLPIAENPEDDFWIDNPYSIKQTLEPGDFQLRGFFVHDSFVTLNQDGTVFVLERFEDMYEDGSGAVKKKLEIDNTKVSTWPSQNDTYKYLNEEISPFTNSTMFTSIFNADSLITGEVHVLTHLKSGGYDPQINVTLKVSLAFFNPIDSNTTEIASLETAIEVGLSELNQTVFNLELNNTYFIPAGYRLKLSFKAKVSDTTLRADVEILTSERGDFPYTWEIVDGIYSNNFTFLDYNKVLGMQIRYMDVEYPDIFISGVTNDSFYYEVMNITIGTTGSIRNSYNWDNGSTIFFGTSSITILLPDTEGWHYLYVTAKDEYDNLRGVLYKFGYDPTFADLILNSPTNGSIISLDSIIDFSASGLHNFRYEWDNNGTITELLTPYDISSIPVSDGLHILSIYINDTFEETKVNFAFFVDNSGPLIELYNVIDGSTQPAGKVIEVNITDIRPLSYVQYNWDDKSDLAWTPSEGTIFKTYLPESLGIHNLTIFANDSYGFTSAAYFSFDVDPDQILIELRTMKDNSYYYGGDIVEVTVSGINGSIFFSWDGGPEINGTDFWDSVNSILTLNGTNALSIDYTYVHYLNITSFDKDDVKYSVVFTFTLDQENPTEEGSNVSDLNGTRHKSSESLVFLFDDNFTTDSNLIILVSIDGNTNQTLSSQYTLDLYLLTEGEYNLTIYVSDIAGNYFIISIIIFVDDSAPVVDSLDIDNFADLIDGSKYVPANIHVEISLTDEDPLIYSYYSWNNSAFILFVDSFDLVSDEGLSTLVIKVNDSAGNFYIAFSQNVIVDIEAPIINFVFPYNYSIINSDTNLNFLAQDIKDQTIETLKYTWDILPGADFYIGDPEFTINALEFYNHDSIAILSIHAEDIVGNIKLYNFSFTIDKEAPIAEIQIYDYLSDSYIPIFDANNSYVSESSDIIINDVSSDIKSFIYIWDENGTEFVLESPWVFPAITLTGTHSIKFILLDTSGEGTSPNINIFYYNFTIRIKGNLLLHEFSQSITYGDDFLLNITLNDDLNSTSQEITEIIINGQNLDTESFVQQIYSAIDNSVLIIISAQNINIYPTTKGSLSLQIYAASAYYFDDLNSSDEINLEVNPIIVNLQIYVSNYSIIENNNVIFDVYLSEPNGDPLVNARILIYIEITFVDVIDTSLVYALSYNDSYFTNEAGYVGIPFEMTEDIDFITARIVYEGDDTHDFIEQIIADPIYTIPPLGLPKYIIYIIIASSIGLAVIASYIVYRIVRKKSIEKAMAEIDEQTILQNLDRINPGVVLCIFEQTRGAMPLVREDSLETEYLSRMTIGVDNFLLKISDQAYSSLGFGEAVHESRRIGTIILPKEKMAGFIHGLQLEIESARGGLENLVLVVLVDADHDEMILANKHLLYDLIDVLREMLHEEKALNEIRAQLVEIRKQTVRIILAALELE